MKKNLFYVSVLLAAVLSGCMEDRVEVVENPVQTGDEMQFGSTLAGTGEIDTRTVYGDRTSSGIPVYWKEEGDEIAIFCPQASMPASKLVHYTVYPQMDENNKPTAGSSAVVKINADEAGLQWGEPGEHRFYAFYPGDRVLGTENDGKILSEVPWTQNVTSWREGEINGTKTYFGLPNMDFAYMYAYNAVDSRTVEKDDPINLDFHNLLTVLDITVQGPAVNSTPIKVTNINVHAKAGTNLVLNGKFYCYLRDGVEGHQKGFCEPVGNTAVTRDRISISTYDPDTQDFKVLNPGEQLNVKAYLLPDDISDPIQPQQLEITVTVQGSEAKSKLLEQAVIKPHLINRVRLPKLVAEGTNFWMERLPLNVYVSELSLPGSKMSVLTEANDANIVYQNATIEQQFKDGVRAFILQTSMQRDWIGEDNFHMYLMSGEHRVCTIDAAIKQIADYLAACEQNGKPKEFAFLMLTYAGGEHPITWVGADPDQRFWMYKLQEKINELKNKSEYRIYTGEMTPNTVLDDVKGKIIVKANYNTENMIRDYTGEAPILFSWWKNFFPEEQVQNGGMDMPWGNPKDPAKLKWYYQEVTSVGPGAEATKEQKETYIKHLFQESVELYKHDTSHKTWFMNDLGGYYTTSATNSQGAKDLAREMNQLGIDELQKRGENASLGLIFMNFADMQENSGKEYKSANLISTIIDNNFKFQMRVDESRPANVPSPLTRNTDRAEDEWDE